MCALLRVLWLYMPALRGPVAAQYAVYPSDLVRACLARLLGELDWEDRMEALLLLACNHRAGDRVSLESMGIGARGYESEFLDLMAEAVELGEINEAAYRDLLWRLHPVEAVAPMLARAMDPSLDREARKRMVDGIAFCEAHEAADAMFVLWHTGPDDTREEARWWFQNRSENLWRRFTTEVAEGDFGAATRRWSSGVVRQGLRDVDVDVSSGERLWLVVTDGGDGHGCDWADWLDPAFLMEDGSAAPVRGWDSAEQGWGMTRLDKNAGGGLLQVEDMVFQKGIGTHAAARILVAIPSGARRFQGRVGPDYGGTKQGGGSTMEFQVWVEDADAQVAIDPRRLTLMDASAAWAKREQAARALAADPVGGLFLLTKAEQGQLPERLIAAATEAIYSNSDLGVRALATAHFPRPGMEALPTAAEILALEASAERGREVFRSEVSRCSACHAHTGLGLDIGPDLTAIRSKYGRAEILDAILNPSAAIAFGYDTYLVQTTDDEYISGFLLAEGEDVILKDTLGERYVIPASDIAHKKKQDLSVMPEGLAMGMSAQDLADLVAFLSRDPEREPDFGDPARLFNGHDFTGWTHHLGGRAERDDVWSISDGVLGCTGRPAGYLRTEADHLNYELTLEWRFDPKKGAGNSGVLCRMTGRDKVWPRSMEAQLQSGSAGDIWNIDAYPMVTAPGRTNGRHTRGLLGSSEKPLGEWNRYRLLLDRGYLRLEVNGVLQNEAFWCEELPGKICLQSEGAYIEFRNVVLRPILN
jgi:putative heme-binding domain-containing protein